MIEIHHDAHCDLKYIQKMLGGISIEKALNTSLGYLEWVSEAKSKRRPVHATRDDVRIILGKHHSQEHPNSSFQVILGLFSRKETLDLTGVFSWKTVAKIHLLANALDCTSVDELFAKALCDFAQAIHMRLEGCDIISLLDDGQPQRYKPLLQVGKHA